MPDKTIIDFNAAVARIVTKEGVFEGAPAEMPDRPAIARTYAKAGLYPASNDGMGDDCQCVFCKPTKVIPFPGAPC